MATRGGSSSRGNRGGKSSYARTRTNNLKYGTPLPILVPASPLHPAYVEPPVPEFILARRRAQAKERGETGPVEGEPEAKVSLAFLVQLFSKLSTSTRSTEPVVPRCKGTYDPLTRSVFVTSPADRDVLFDRGFFGKGNLSRSEASWKTRRVKLLQEIAGQAAAAGHAGQGQGKKMTAEEVTAERRRERKQFKIDRAQAILNASLAAEAILRSSIPSGEPDTSDTLRRIDSTISNTTTTTTTTTAASTTTPLASQTDMAIPSVTDYAHVLPEGVTRLTPQTFLQRPTRPDNKPKGRKAPVQAGTTTPNPQPTQEQTAPEMPSGADLVDPDSVEDMEHLQLNLEEALFLSWGVGCLDVIDPKTVRHSETLDIVPPISPLLNSRFFPARTT